jgi:hypothetical protein
MWLQLIPLILSIVGELPSLITKAEAAFSGKPGSGALKKSFVVEAAGAALNAYQTLSPHPLAPDHVSSVLGTISTITDATVAAMNTAGILMGKPASTTPAV